jgi:hypothetical protein
MKQAPKPERGVQLWTVYKGASDVPETRYCARLSIIKSGGAFATDMLMKSDDIEELRETFAALGLVRINRREEDDPVIVEVWI